MRQLSTWFYWWWFPTPVVRCAVSHNWDDFGMFMDVPKVHTILRLQIAVHGHCLVLRFYTLLRNNRINWNVQCWSMLKLILSWWGPTFIHLPGTSCPPWSIGFTWESLRHDLQTRSWAFRGKSRPSGNCILKLSKMGYHGVPWDTDTVPWDTDHGWFRDLWAQILRWFHDVSNQSDESIRLPWPVMAVWWHLLKICLKSAKKCLLCWHCAWEDCCGFEDLNG